MPMNSKANLPSQRLPMINQNELFGPKRGIQSKDQSLTIKQEREKV